MRIIAPCLAVLAVSASLALAPSGAAAQRVVIDGKSQDSVVRFEQRMAPRTAIRAMTNRSGNVDLLHIDGAVALQLTDAGLDAIRVNAEKSDAQGGLARLFEGMVVGGLRVLLDRAMIYDLRDVGDVRYENEEIVFENRQGERVFGSFNVHGEEVLASFDEREARAFVAHLKRHLPR